MKNWSNKQDTLTHKNGCFNRKPFADTVWVQSGYYVSQHGGIRTSKMVEIVNPMSKDCRYSIEHTSDPGCVDCKWKAK